MRTLVVLFSFLAVISAYHIRDGVLFTGEDPTAELLHEEKIERIVRGVYSTPLDHFSPTNNITLKLKYEMNIAFFKQGGPLFFFTDGFGELHRYGLMSELAEKLNGALITAHFRYHGQNSFEYVLHYVLLKRCGDHNWGVAMQLSSKCLFWNDAIQH